VAEEPRVRPFYCGSQFIDWQDANCCQCAKYSFQVDPATGKTREPLDEDEVCQIELALHRAALDLDDVTVSAEMGRRMGFVDPWDYNWRCGEFERVQQIPEVRP